MFKFLTKILNNRQKHADKEVARLLMCEFPNENYSYILEKVRGGNIDEIFKRNYW